MEEDKKRAATDAPVEPSMSPDRSESIKPQAVTLSPQKKRKCNDDETGSQEQEDQSSEVDSPKKEDLSSAFEEAKDSENKPQGDPVTADTVMGFPRYPDRTNRYIVTQHPDFVLWARRKHESGEAFGNLRLFVEWLDTPEGQELDFEGQGNQKLGFGKYGDITFKQLAKTDPDYHVRFMSALKRKGEEPDPMLALYASFYERYQDKLKPNDSNNSHDNQIFTFGKYNGKSFREVAKSDPGYHVRYRRALEERGENLSPQLLEYIKWYNANSGADPLCASPRMKSNELGNQRFTFGQHKGKTFRWVARIDPSYHLRFIDMNPGVALQKLKDYLEFFDRHGNEYEAHREHRMELGWYAGVL